MSHPHPPSLPSTDLTLAPSISNLTGSTLHIPPGRAVSNASSIGRSTTRSRRSGGFLLEPTAGGGVDGVDRDRELYGGNHRGRAVAAVAGFFNPEMPLRMFREPEVDADTDPARIVSLALANGASRKVETTRRGPQQQKHRSVSASRWLPGDHHGYGGGDGEAEREREKWLGGGSYNGRDRAISPSRGFLVTASIDQRRSVSTGTYNSGSGGGGGGGRRLSPLNPSSSPPPTLRHSSGPSPVPAAYQQLQKRRGMQGHDQLRELQRQYKFSEATLQRTLKAKQQLELAALYKRLLTIYPTDSPSPGSAVGGGGGGRAYNPLMSIRNKRIRNRERIQLDLTSWEDPGAVEQWIEDVAVSVHESADGHGRPPMLPPPPQPTGVVTKQKRPRLDWVISPQELLAEFYWIEEGVRMRQEEMRFNDEQQQREEEGRRQGQGQEGPTGKKVSHQSLRSLLEREKGEKRKEKRSSFEFTRRKRSARSLVEDGLERRAKTKISGEFHRFLQSSSHRDGSEEYGSPLSSADESGLSSQSEFDFRDDEFSDMEKHHRRRRKLGQIIKGGGKLGKAKKRGGDVYALDAEERRKRQEMEEVEWMAEMGGTAGMRRSFSADEEYDSAGVGRSTPKQVAAPGGSRSSLERYQVPTRRSVDFAEVVVPSIAISLSPPRARPRDEDDTDGRGRVKRLEEENKDEKRKMSPTKKLFERSQEAFGRVREGSLDRRRESLESSRDTHTQKESTIGRVKSRVEKIRNEVAKVEDFILRRDPSSSAAASPTGSVFSESIGSRSDDDRGRLTRESTAAVSASEAEDEGGRRGGRTWGRSSLEVPDVRRPTGPTKYRSSYSMSYLPTISSPADPDMVDTYNDHRRSRRHRTPKGERLALPPVRAAEREPSPARSVVMQAVQTKAKTPPGTAAAVLPPTAPPIAPPTAPPIAPPSALPSAAPTPPLPPVAPCRPVTRRDLMLAHAYLLRAGVFARNITALRPHTSESIVTAAKEHLQTATLVSRDIHHAEQLFVRKANFFTDNPVRELLRAVERIRADLDGVLNPMLARVADGADALNEELTTSCTLAVKGTGDEVAAMARRKRRQMRWVRRGGYVLLEWAVLGVMWWVWLVVVVLNIVRAVARVCVGAVRWVLWI